MTEVECDRCQRVEYVDEKEVKPVRFVATMGYEPKAPKEVVEPIFHVMYEDLCGPCQKTVGKHLEAIKRDFKGKSPDRTKEPKKKAKKKAGDSAGSQPDAPSV
jgi:hypothetical protein